MIESKTKLIIGIFVVILLFAGFFSIFYYYQRTKTVVEMGTKKILKPNWYQQAQKGQWSKEIQAADALFKENKSAEAIKILEGVKSQMTDSGEKSIVDLTIAYGIFFAIDRQQGAQRYATIAKTVEYPAVSRAYGMLLVADNFDGSQDKNLLKSFFDEQEFISTDKSVLIAVLYERIYDTYPFGLAAAKVASKYLRKVSQNNAISDTDYAVVIKYVADINKNLIELETTEPFKNFIPVTLLIKANLFKLIESVGRPTSEPAADVYLLAIARARILRISSTEQFSVLFYADYLAKKKEKDQVIRLLSESLSSSSLDKIVRGFLQSKELMQNRFPNLYQLQQDDHDVQAVYKGLIS